MAFDGVGSTGSLENNGTRRTSDEHFPDFLHESPSSLRAEASALRPRRWPERFRPRGLPQEKTPPAVGLSNSPPKTLTQ
ncbi:unnamed protein product [Nesidiocoris tenuis]|uniref:Uncharacterized protein n=1 Tax=Nesidiocoris tenuis TaxID=355587 RepID=A0A6H5G9P9_9HEMI|nr:unnamed protein product [Nesidiocoris tenuis]